MITVKMPGVLFDFLDGSDIKDKAARAALDGGKAIKRGNGYSVEVTADLDTHHHLLERCWVLDGGGGVDSTPSERHAYRVYARRVDHAGRISQ